MYNGWKVCIPFHKEAKHGTRIGTEIRRHPGPTGPDSGGFPPFLEDHVSIWTLRRRYENGVSVCTLKTPGENGGRGEWELECPTIEEAVPELCKLSGIRELLLLAEAGLIPVCGARFTRQTGSLEAEGCTLELAVDSGVLLGGGRELPLCEIEAELKDGSEEAALACAAGLAAKYGLDAEPRSKYRRALMIGKGEL